MRTTMRRARRTFGSFVVGSTILFLGWSGPLLAGVFYVDGACPNDGNGASIPCASAPGGAGAFKNLQSGLNALSAPGDVLYVRGVHGTFDGRYNSDRFVITGKNGSA